MVDFRIGDVYYQVYFQDRDFAYPILWSFVFLGMNVLEEEESDAWYFQDCQSFVESGSFVKNKSEECTVLALTEAAAKDMLDLKGMILTLTDAASRRSKK